MEEGDLKLFRKLKKGEKFKNEVIYVYDKDFHRIFSW